MNVISMNLIYSTSTFVIITNGCPKSRASPSRSTAPSPRYALRLRYNDLWLRTVTLVFSTCSKYSAVLEKRKRRKHSRGTRKERKVEEEEEKNGFKLTEDSWRACATSGREWKEVLRLLRRNTKYPFRFAWPPSNRSKTCKGLLELNLPWKTYFSLIFPLERERSWNVLETLVQRYEKGVSFTFLLLRNSPFSSFFLPVIPPTARHPHPTPQKKATMKLFAGYFESAFQRERVYNVNYSCITRTNVLTRLAVRYFIKCTYRPA